ncbi:MAG: oligosaccharide flippase family protein [Methylibium sp.]|uniref:oligosaccharide flippase family protein n=1 Tax=Methylibium sp. TaxID=2067992 RepID=UPI00181FF845|nr:oligosaccharide flippase family protein [Methylibium sp.]MBA3597207.1 oligosaccharide flippase family protein [Methylibium sp.]
MSQAATTLSLKLRTFRAAGWTVGGHAASQLLRFGSNLILTRLLFPEVFGLMAIIQAVMMGVAMLSDIGVTQSIIRSNRAHDERFMNTAWTIQIAKGVFMWLVLCLIAAPLAAAYDEPLLAWMLPVAGLAAVISGFYSTNGAMASRNIDAKRITFISIGGHILTVMATVLLAWYDPTPWALVWGNLIGASVQMLASHVLLPGARNRFAWERQSARDIISFGGAVLLSSSLTFFAGEGNKLVAGLLLDMRMLGLLGLASTLNLVIWSAIQLVGSRVLYPAYSEVMRTEPARLSSIVERSRLVQVLPTWSAALFFAVFGRQVIEFLYDPRYADAGVILQIQALGLMAGVLSMSYTGVLWAAGKIGLSTALLAAQGVLQIGGMFVGSQIAGQFGVLVGIALSGVLMYPITAAVYARQELFHAKVDVPVILASIAAAVGVVLSNDWTGARAW